MAVVAVALAALALSGCKVATAEPAKVAAPAQDSRLVKPSQRVGRIAVMAVQDVRAKSPLASRGEELFFDAVPIHATESRGVVRVWVLVNELRMSPEALREWAESEEFGTLNADDDVEIPTPAVHYGSGASDLYWVTVRTDAEGRVHTRVQGASLMCPEDLPVPLDDAWYTPALRAIDDQSHDRTVFAARARAVELTAADR